MSPFSSPSSTVRIVLAYTLFGALWILFSDELMTKLVPAGLTEGVSIAKGWFFIAVTALLLHILINRHLGKIAQILAGARESEALFRSLFEQAAVGVAQIDTATGRFIRINRRYCDIVGYSPEEMTTIDFQIITHPDDLPADQESMRRLIAGDISEYSIEKRYFRKDGEVVWVHLSVSPLWAATGRPVCHIAVAEDITGHKRVEEKLRHHQEHLEELVEERTKELATANERLKEVDRLKSLFIASMSHELRTPLNSVIGFSSILLNEWIGPVSDEQKQSLSSILRSGKHLLLLINDVIDVSKIEAGMIEINYDDFDMAELLAELKQTFIKEADSRRLDLTIPDIHLPMHTDRRRLLQCLLNLVSNAIKFTEHGYITVTVRHDRENGRISIAVIDTGIGIEAADQPKLFQAFSRIQSPLSSRIPGTGLGLYLSKKIIIEILHGTIDVASTPGIGSTFIITIPTRLEGKNPAFSLPLPGEGSDSNRGSTGSHGSEP